MKITFLLELLLIFVIIAFAASKPINQDVSQLRALKQAAAPAAVAAQAVESAVQNNPVAPSDDDDDDDIDLFDVVAGADDDDDDDDDDDEDGDDGDIAEIIGFADEEPAAVEAEEDDDDDDDEDDDDEDDAVPEGAADDDDDGPLDLFDGFFDDDEDDEDSPVKKPVVAADAVVVPTAAPVVPILDVNPTKIAAIISPAAQTDSSAGNTIPLDLAHTPALLQLAQAAANEVDSTNLEPVIVAGAVKGDQSIIVPAENNVVVDVIAESTQQVVNQLSESVANLKQNDIQGSGDSSPVERGANAAAAAKPTTAKPEEDLLDIVESFITDVGAEDDDDEDSTEKDEEKKPETTPTPNNSQDNAFQQNDKDEINDEVDDDEDDLRRK